MPETREHGNARPPDQRLRALVDSPDALARARTVGERRRPWLPRMALIGAGWVAVGLAILGVALPLVPTTPFVLLAAACFARSSPRLHRRLLASRLGPLLVQWRERRSVPPSAKRKACGLVLVTFTASIVTVDPLAPRVLLGVLGCGLLVFLSRLRSEPAAEDDLHERRGAGDACGPGADGVE